MDWHPLCNMSFPLEQRGSPVCLPLPLPAPGPANRIVSGDSSAVMPAQVVPSRLCGGRVSLESQSFADSVSSMRCPCPDPDPLRCMRVSCRACCVSDSDEVRNCFCSEMDPSVVSARCAAMRSRPRAQCTRKIVIDKGRKCRHTSCQRVANVDSATKPVTPVSVIDVLHRDLRTVCVSNSDSSDFVPSANDFQRISYKRSRYGKSDLQIRFSMQRFCSAVLCGLVLLSALRPQFSMAAPVPSRQRTASEENHDAITSTPDIYDMLNNLKLEVDLTLGHFNEKIRNQYCKQVFYLDKECPDYKINIGGFKFIEIPKRLGETVGSDHFDTDEKLDEALRNTLHNFQAYPVHLQKLKEHQIDEEKNFSNQYDVLKEHIKKLHEELLNLMKLRGVEPLPSVTVSDSEIENLHKSVKAEAKAVHWGILVEVINGVEYFSHMIPHLRPAHQSTKL